MPKLDADKQNTLEAAWAAEMDALRDGEARNANRAIAACAQLQQALANRSNHYRFGGKRGDVDLAVAEVVRTSFGLMPDDSPVWGLLTPVSAVPVGGEA